jgi:probable addiction module antidote protein
MMAKITPFDAAKYLDNPETIAAYLTEAFESGDTSFIAAAIGDVARAKGMAKVAAETGLGRESLYKSLSGEVSPNFETVQKVLGSFGMKMVVQPDEEARVA